MLSHELRTPLNAIMSWTHVLQQQGGADMTLRGLKAIERNGKAQARLIADILDMSSINMDKLQLVHEWCDPAELVRSALEDLREQVAARVASSWHSPSRCRRGPSARTSGACAR